MANNKEALALELRQVIQADRMACDLLDEANDIGKNIQQRAETEKATILAEAETARIDMETQVRAEQFKALQNRIEGLKQQYAAQQAALTETVTSHREAWIDEMVARITS